VHKALDVGAGHVDDGLLTEKRLDMPRDPAPVDRERTGFLGDPAAGQQPSGLSVGKGLIAELGDGIGLPGSGLALGCQRIGAALAGQPVVAPFGQPPQPRPPLKSNVYQISEQRQGGPINNGAATLGIAARPPGREGLKQRADREADSGP
jgi:hypothetical protein